MMIQSDEVHYFSGGWLSQPPVLVMVDLEIFIYAGKVS